MIRIKRERERENQRVRVKYIIIPVGKSRNFSLFSKKNSKFFNTQHFFRRNGQMDKVERDVKKRKKRKKH